MRFEIIGRNITVTDTMREKIEKKLSSLEKAIRDEEQCISCGLCELRCPDYAIYLVNMEE